MKHEKVEFRQRLDFGQLISYFFEFVKYNWQGFSNAFLRYNGIFILAFIGVSYLMVSGYFGLINSLNINGSFSSEYESYTTTVFAGLFIYFVLLLLVTAVNYGISSVYMSEYVKLENTSQQVDGRVVWKIIKKRSGSLALFMLLLVLLSIAWLIVFVILAFIPLIGALFGYALLFGLLSWAGVSCMAMFHEEMGPADALGYGWNLLMSNFWKCVGVNFVLGIIIGILRLFILSIPGIIGFFLFYLAVEERSLEITDTIFTITWTMFVAVATVVSIYAQALGQFMNGGLYFSLSESKTNNFLRSKIEQIGVRE